MVGLAVYRVAVDKHRANTVINEANKRATIVAMQFQQGTTEGSLNEFDNDLGYAVFNSSVITSPDNENQFQISFTTVPETSVCQQIKSLIPATSVIRKITDNCDTFTYNKDLSSTVYASDFGNETDCTSADKKWCTTAGKCTEGECCVSENCNANSCPDGSSVDGAKAGAKTGVFVAGEECVCDNEGQTYVGGSSCISPGTCDSWTVNQCGRGWYCEFDTYTATASDYATQMCYNNVTGTCKKITISPTPIELNFGGTTDTTIYKYMKSVNWWTAASFCVGDGKQIVSLSDVGFLNSGQVGCYETETAHCLRCPCGRLNDSCTSATAEGCDSETQKCDCWTYLKNKLTRTYFWTKTPFSTKSGDYTCYVHGFRTVSTGQAWNDRRSGSRNILCK